MNILSNSLYMDGRAGVWLAGMFRSGRFALFMRSGGEQRGKEEEEDGHYHNGQQMRQAVIYVTVRRTIFRDYENIREATRDSTSSSRPSLSAQAIARKSGRTAAPDKWALLLYWYMVATSVLLGCKKALRWARRRLPCIQPWTLPIQEQTALALRNFSVLVLICLASRSECTLLHESITSHPIISFLKFSSQWDHRDSSLFLLWQVKRCVQAFYETRVGPCSR